MIVDCHTHLSFPVNDSEAAEHLDACANVDACIVLPVSKNPEVDTNAELGRYVSRHSKMVGFAVIDPVAEKVTEKSLRRIVDSHGLKGVVLYCPGSGFHPADTAAMQLYEQCEKLGLCVFFNNSASFNPHAVLDYAQPYLLDEIARSFPELKMVIGSMGRPFVDQTICMISKHEHVYADLTISPRRVWEAYTTVVAAHEHGVMDKLLFGSGYPSGKADGCIELLLGFNMMLAEKALRHVPREKIRSIIERDTLKLLGIEK